MINLDRHIEFLLMRHDCVIIPGLGAFVAQYHPSHQYDDKLIPPTRSVGFNPAVSHNDGLLASSIARRENITYESALNLLTREVTSLKAQLFNGSEIVIPGVGTLKCSSGSTIQFAPDEDGVASLPFRGLPTIEALTIDQRSALSSNDNSQSERKSSGNVIYLPVHKAVIRVAAAVAMLFGVGLLCSTPKVADYAVQDMASLNIRPALAQVEESIEQYESQSSQQLFIKTPSPFEATMMVDTVGRKWYQNYVARQEAQAQAFEEARKQREAILSQQLNNSGATGEYCVVVASLPTLQRAQTWVASQRNANLRILNQDGRFRVYITTATTEFEAKSIAGSHSMQSRYPGAWVTRK